MYTFTPVCDNWLQNTSIEIKLYSECIFFLKYQDTDLTMIRKVFFAKNNIKHSDKQYRERNTWILSIHIRVLCYW